MEWLPIETRPKDERLYLVYCEGVVSLGKNDKHLDDRIETYAPYFSTIWLKSVNPSGVFWSELPPPPAGFETRTDHEWEPVKFYTANNGEEKPNKWVCKRCGWVKMLNTYKMRVSYKSKGGGPHTHNAWCIPTQPKGGA